MRVELVTTAWLGPPSSEVYADSNVMVAHAARVQARFPLVVTVDPSTEKFAAQVLQSARAESRPLPPNVNV